MGILTGLLTLPLAPVRGTMWVAEILLEDAERQMNHPALSSSNCWKRKRRTSAAS